MQVHELEVPNGAKAMSVETDLNPQEMAAILGPILQDSTMGAAVQDEKNLLDFMHDAYEHGGGLKGHPMGGEVDPETGAFSYPGDPVQMPLCKVNVGDDYFWFYDHAIIAFPTDDGFLVSRID